MLPLEITLAFFGTSVLLAATPGPDNLYVLFQSALHGRATGIAIVLGLCTGLVVHTSAVALGLAALLAASETAYAVVKLAGAAYLAALGWQALRARPRPFEAHGTGSAHWGRMYARGIAMNVSNPKVAVFFLAFLPQFTDPRAGRLVLQIAWLGLVFVAATLVTFGAIVCFSAALGERFRRSPRAQLVLNRAAGAILLVLAVKLAFSNI
jgi:threonine/homoserine/homoserine lactone efflux protein